MKRIAAAIVFFASVNVCAAFEIGDGQYAGTYNDQNFDAAASKFNTIVVPKQNDAPVGTIISWSLLTDPEDAEYWLECDGRAVDPNMYPELYAMMTHTPDYRGRFLIGAGKDGRAVGTVQESNLARHDFKGAYNETVELQSSASLEPYDCSHWEYQQVTSNLDGKREMATYYYNGWRRACGASPCKAARECCCKSTSGSRTMSASECRSYAGDHYDSNCGSSHSSCSFWIQRTYSCGTCPDGYEPYSGCGTATTTCRKWIEQTCYKDSSTYYNKTLDISTGENTSILIPLRTSSEGETRPANYAVRYLIRAKKVE